LSCVAGGCHCLSFCSPIRQLTKQSEKGNYLGKDNGETKNYCPLSSFVLISSSFKIAISSSGFILRASLNAASASCRLFCSK